MFAAIALALPLEEAAAQTPQQPRTRLTCEMQRGQRLSFVDNPMAPAGVNRRRFLVGSLRSLDASIGGTLVVRDGDPVDLVAKLATEVDAGEVFVSADFAPYGSRRDQRVEQRLAVDGRVLQRVGSPYAVEPGTVRNGSGQPYKMFTPFSKAWLAHGWSGSIRAPRRCAVGDRVGRRSLA